jgi:hypothetical protein
MARHKTSLNFNLRFGPEKRIYLRYGRDTVSSQEVGQKAASHISKRMARSDHELTFKGIAHSCQTAKFPSANLVKKQNTSLCFFSQSISFSALPQSRCEKRTDFRPQAKPDTQDLILKVLRCGILGGCRI